MFHSLSLPAWGRNKNKIFFKKGWKQVVDPKELKNAKEGWGVCSWWWTLLSPSISGEPAWFGQVSASVTCLGASRDQVRAPPTPGRIAGFMNSLHVC